MRIEDLLKEDVKTRLEEYRKRSQTRLRKRKKHIEKLSFRDIKELMGVYRDTYKRGKGGAWRRK